MADVGKRDPPFSANSKKPADNLPSASETEWDDSHATRAKVAGIMHEIVYGLRDLARKERWPSDRLSKLHTNLQKWEQNYPVDKKLFSDDPNWHELLKPKSIIGWARLVGMAFEKHQATIAYRRLCEEKDYNQNWTVQRRHLDRMRAVLIGLEIISDADAPAYGERPSSWRLFLLYARDKFNERKSRRASSLKNKDSTLSVAARDDIAVTSNRNSETPRPAVSEPPKIIRPDGPFLTVWPSQYDTANYSPLRQIIRELMDLGRLPLAGARIATSEAKLKIIKEELHAYADRELWRIPQPDLLVLTAGLLRLGRRDPQLHAHLRPHTDALVGKAISTESQAIRSEIHDRPTRDLYERLAYELPHLLNVALYAHGELLTPPPDIERKHEHGLSLDVPQLALCVISIQMARLSAGRKPEESIALFANSAMPIIDRYKHLDVGAIAVKLFCAPNPDIDIKTCIGHVYRDLSNAYIVLATKQSPDQRRETLGLARGSIEKSFEWYSSAEPPWLHGIATLNATRYVFEIMYGSSERAQELRREVRWQLEVCGDSTRLKWLALVDENHPNSLLQFLVSL
jgi:hypothetical protein